MVIGSMRLCHLVSLLSLLMVQSRAIDLLVVTGGETPTEIFDLLRTEGVKTWLPSNPAFNIAVVDSSKFDTLTSLLGTAVAVLDVTFSSLEVQMIAGACGMYEVPHLVLGYISEAVFHPWTFYLSGRYQELAHSLNLVVTNFGWSQVNLITDTALASSAISAFLAAVPVRSYQDINFALTDQIYVNRTVGRAMRLSGNRINVFLTAPKLTKSIIAAQWEMSIGGAGFANVVLLYTSLYSAELNDTAPNLSTGNLILAEEELSGVTSISEYYIRQLSIAAGFFTNYTDNFSVKGTLNQMYPVHFRNSNFTLLNMQSGLRVPVGQVNSTLCSITGLIFFLGNSTSIPLNAKSPLQISGNLGVRNWNSYYMTALYYYHGATLAIDQINARSDVLQNFVIELLNFTAGVQVWNYDFAYTNIYPIRNQLGLALFTSTSSVLALQIIPLLRSLNYSGPIVGSSNTVNALSSTETYPTYIRTVLPDRFIVGVYLQMFKRFGWTKCGLFVSNETWGLGIRSAFSVLAQENGIEIMNDPILQILPSPIPSVDTLRNYTKNFQNFIETKARILIIAVNNNAVLLIDYLYELGMRGGDIQIVANEFLSLGYISTNDTDLYRKRSELLYGAIQFSPVSYIGSFGNQVLQDYIATYGSAPPVYSCFYYDSALAIAYALDIVIQLGEDYTNPSIVMKAIRSSRYTGCTGVVTFEPGTNDRAPMQYNILNAQYGGNGTLITNITTVGRYDPTGTIVFKFFSDLIWCSGTTVFPGEVRMSTIGCPFEDKFNQDFPPGRYLVYGVCAGIALLTALITTFIWKTWWNRSLEKLTEKKEIQVQDVILMLGIALELLQYISMGPDLIYLSSTLKMFEEATTLNLRDWIDLKNGGFGSVWMGVMITTILWVLMCLVVFFHLDYKLECIPGCRFFGDISEAAIPLIGNIVFLPIVSVFADSYVCVRGVGMSSDVLGFTDSYLDLDCYLNCWQGAHLLYVIGSSIGLFVYLPAAILLRPVWQEIQGQINIKTSAHFLMVKTVVQVCLVVLNKTVKTSNPTVHAFIYLALFLPFIIFCIKVQCFGYRRTALWHVISLIVVFWTTSLSTLQLVTSSDQNGVFLGIALGGCAVFCIIGTVYQVLKVPNMLYRKPGVDASHLFRFAFKRATVEILNALRENFEQVGHRNSIIMPKTPTETARRYAVASEEPSAERQINTSRVNESILPGRD